MRTKNFIKRIAVFLLALVLTIGVIIPPPVGSDPKPNPRPFPGGEDIEINNDDLPFSVSEQNQYPEG